MMVLNIHFPRTGTRLTPIASALLALGLAAAGSARAQQVQAPVAASAQAPTDKAASKDGSAPKKKDDKVDDSVQQLDTVVITAGKRTEKLREVAGSVTALQGTDLENRGVKDEEDMFKLTPGVQFNKQGGDLSVITIRGIGTSAQANFVQGTTGVYLEDVPFNDPYVFRTAPDVAPFDLERVEVLRGPQGVLYGSSSMGGAVRYLFNKPDLKQTEFSALTEMSGTDGGGFNHAEYAMGNVGIGETAGVRAVVFNRDEDGWLNNALTGQKRTNKLHESGGRFLAKFQPTKELNINAMYLTSSTKVDDSFDVQDFGTLSKTTATSLSPRKSKFDLTSLEVSYDLPLVRLTSTTGYLNKYITQHADENRYAAFYGPGAFIQVDEHSHALSEEFRISSLDGSALSWLAGVFYQRYAYDQNDSIGLPAFDTSIPVPLKSKATESSVFGQADYAFSNGLTIGAGARYYQTADDLNTVAGEEGGAPHSSDHGITPRVSIKYKFANDDLVYALVSRGYRFGGFNIVKFTPDTPDPSFVTPATYKSDSLTNYEVGWRLAPAASVRLDLTAFLIDWKDLQLNVPRPGDSDPYVTNIGSARSTGLEALATWTPMSALTLSSSIAYTHARITTAYASPTGTAPSGTPMPGAAKFQIANLAGFRFEGPMATLGRVTLTHTYVGKSYNDLFKTVQQGGYSTFDARVAFDTDHWEFTVFGNNVTNKKAVAGASAFAPYFTDYFVNKPRTIGMSLRYDM